MKKNRHRCLYNLAELQNDCSKMFKISPDETLKCSAAVVRKQACNLPKNRCQSSFNGSCKGDKQKYFRLAILSAMQRFCTEYFKATVLQEPCKD